MRMQVAIIGAGPAGLLLSHLLHREGIESVVLEARSREYVEQRVRAGVLEHPTVQLLDEVGLADRLHREGLQHGGIHLLFDGERHHLDFTELIGKTITVYGQQEVVKDLIAARTASGGDVRFEVSDVALHDLDTDRPGVTFTHDGAAQRIECDIVAGCDGFRGVSRGTIPPGVLTEYQRDYPFAWLGILAEAPPSSPELIYAYHDNGFALHSMRSPKITRNYLQVQPDEDLADWSDARIWDELQTRLATEGEPALTEGPLIEKGVTAMRSFVVEPMQYGRLFLAGDAAHIVPPTGAKGMNLAVADVRVLARAITRFEQKGEDDLLRAYSATCLKRVWRAEHFSWWMTSMLHRFDGDDPTDDALQRQLQLSQLRYTVSSHAAAASLAENYVGLPVDGDQ
jgi:p-hydroxybenzoate 3-monooxygenase